METSGTWKGAVILFLACVLAPLISMWAKQSEEARVSVIDRSDPMELHAPCPKKAVQKGACAAGTVKVSVVVSREEVRVERRRVRLDPSLPKDAGFRHAAAAMAEQRIARMVEQARHLLKVDGKATGIRFFFEIAFAPGVPIAEERAHLAAK